MRVGFDGADLIVLIIVAIAASTLIWRYCHGDGYGEYDIHERTRPGRQALPDVQARPADRGKLARFYYEEGE